MKQQHTDTSGDAPTSEVKTGGKEVRLYPYVRRDTKTGILEYSRPYPVDVEIHKNGKRVKNYTKSLNTRNPVDANKLAPEKYAEFERIVDSAKAKNVIPYKGRQELLGYLQEHSLIPAPETDIDLFALQDIIIKYQDKFIDSIHALNKQGEGVTLTNDHPAYVLAHLRDWEGQFQGKGSRKSILMKQYATTPFAKKAPQIANVEPVQNVSVNNGNRQSDGIANKITFRDAFNKWNEQQRSHRGKLYKEQPVKLFEQVHGQKPLAQVAEEDIMKVITMFAQTPLGKPKKQSFVSGDKKELTLPELHALAKSGQFQGKKRNSQTVRKILDVYANLYKVATMSLKAHTLVNIAKPMLEVFDSETAEVKRRRVGYSTDDLKKLFHSPVYKGCKGWNARHIKGTELIKDSYYWLPLIGLFTGCREEEIGQLSIGDIRQYGNIRYFDINDDDDTKRLKNPESRRYIPIHEELVKCGFLQYYEQIKEAGHKKLFPEMVEAWQNSKDKRYTKTFSQWYSRYCKKIGIILTIEESTRIRKDFHSLRHGFKTVCRQVIEKDAIHDFFTGHARPKNVGTGYGEDNPMSYRDANDNLQRISYSGLDLSHLYISGAGKPLPIRPRPPHLKKVEESKPNRSTGKKFILIRKRNPN